MREWDFFLKPFSGDGHGLKFDIKLWREDGDVTFRFRMRGPRVAEILRARPAPAGFAKGERRDELWKTTCFELFFGQTNRLSYVEVNMSPSGDFAAYGFTGYREGMTPLMSLRQTPVRDVRSSEESLELMGSVSLRSIQLDGPVVLGATAVLEYLDGTKEYWALAHKGAKPDFHISSSFIASV